MNPTLETSIMRPLHSLSPGISFLQRPTDVGPKISVPDLFHQLMEEVFCSQATSRTPTTCLLLKPWMNLVPETPPVPGFSVLLL